MDIKEFRFKFGLKQGELAEMFDVSQSTVTRIEKGELDLKQEYITILDKFLKPHGTTCQELGLEAKMVSNVKAVVGENYINVAYLSAKAQAGYLDSFNTQTDADYLNDLNTILVSDEYKKGNFLIVEDVGDSMNDGTIRSIPDGTKLLCKELDKNLWGYKLHYRTNLFIVVTSEGVVLKQIVSHDLAKGEIMCHSFNNLYSDYVVKMTEIYKIFYVKKIIERKIIF